MIGGALLAGIILAGLVMWSARGADGDMSGPGFATLRFVGGIGLTALAVLALQAGAPAAAFVAAPIAAATFAAPFLERGRAQTEALLRPAPVPGAHLIERAEEEEPVALDEGERRAA